jgi:hypothetical protein
VSFKVMAAIHWDALRQCRDDSTLAAGKIHPYIIWS